VDRCILIVDDDASLLDLLRAQLESKQYQVVSVESPERALRCLADKDFSAVLIDIGLPGMSGVDLCREIVTLRENTPVIVMTAFASIESAVASIRAGAYDFVTKPFEADDLALTMDRALRHRELREEVKRLQRAVSDLQPPHDMIGESDAMKKMYEVVARVAEAEAAVLVTGESGTGKELVAQTIHKRSPRASGPFVAINCAAMPESLLESELFGHVKGAFTDARTSWTGLFVKASGGAILLDEVGEMPVGMQAKLLRALQERTVRPVGGDTEIPFDARIIAATNRDLDVAVREGRFREDLFYRINVVQVHVPPLRSRENDVLLLAHAFLQRHQAKGGEGVIGLTSATAERLLAYAWPGNVRELQNCIERAVALARFDRIGVEDLPDRIAQGTAPRVAMVVGDGSPIVSLDEMDRRYVVQVLEAMGGNKASAARMLGMDRRTLYRKLERWGILASSPRQPVPGFPPPAEQARYAPC
jgi:two-component system response regulator AtoC